MVRKARRVAPNAVVVAMGCHTQMCRDEKDADIVVGTDDRPTLIPLLLEKLNIKNRELQTMISMASQFHVHDTIPIPIHDTIFCEPDFAFDTCVSDEWRTTCVEMRYPNEVCVDATMRSQKEVFVTAKRETIEPPSKCFFIRWFQKKHIVTRITINEENPYIEDQENVYIRVID